MLIVTIGNIQFNHQARSLDYYVVIINLETTIKSSCLLSMHHYDIQRFYNLFEFSDV